MNDLDFNSQTVIECFPSRVTNKWFAKRAEEKALLEFVCAPSHLAYSITITPEKRWKINLIHSTEDATTLFKQDKYPRTQFVRCLRDSFSISLKFADLEDKNKTNIELALETNLRIQNLSMFLDWAKLGLGQIVLNTNLSTSEIEVILIDKLQSFISYQILSKTYEDLKQNSGFPEGWWQMQIPEIIRRSGLKLESVSKVRWESGLLSLQEEARTKQNEFKILSQMEADALEWDKRRYKTLTKYEKNRLQIENDKTKSAFDQVLELDALELRRQIDNLNFEIEKEEKNANRCRLYFDPFSAEKAQKQHGELIQSIQNVKEELIGFSRLVKQFSQVLTQHSGSTLNRLVVKASNISLKALEMIGADSTPQYLAQVFRQKSAHDNLIIIIKINLCIRDIMTQKVDVMTINSPLQFEFTTERSGYATILDIGSSGRILLHSPNAYVAPKGAVVKKNTDYQVPGCHLLDINDLRDNCLQYVVRPPIGWEDMVVIISDEPIIDAGQIIKLKPRNPFLQLRSYDLEAVIDRLADLPLDGWSSGVLSFLIE